MGLLIRPEWSDLQENIKTVVIMTAQVNQLLIFKLLMLWCKPFNSCPSSDPLKSSLERDGLLITFHGEGRQGRGQ
jgi:hypothetical protein